MGKIKDKYKNWKSQKFSKFREQNLASYNETKKQAQKVRNIYENEKKLDQSLFIYKSSKQQSIFKASKKMFNYSYIFLPIILIILTVLMGCLKLVNFVPYKINPEELKTLNSNIWLLIFIPFIVVAILSLIYFITTIILQQKANKKFKSDINFINSFNTNKVVAIIFFVLIIISFFSTQPFALAPLSLLAGFELNSIGCKILILITTFFHILYFLSIIFWITTFIIAWSTSPKFNIKQLFPEDIFE